MPLFQWSDDYCVGLKSVDSQHKNLFEMINALQDAMQKGQGKNITAPLLRRLFDYTRQHFTEEEKLMQSARYPGLSAHRAQHLALTQKVSDFIQRSENCGKVVNVDLLFFLTDWLKTHIKQEDKAYAPWLAAGK